MGLKEDLEQLIRESYEIIHEHQTIIQASNRPEEKHRSRQKVEEGWALIEGYLREYLPICGRLQIKIPDDIAQLAARFPKLDVCLDGTYLSPEENLLPLCHDISKDTLEILRGDSATSGLVYLPFLYIDRGDFIGVLREFYASNQPCLAIVGEAGIGKTSLLCHLVENQLGKIPTIFYTAQYLLNDSIQSTLSADIESRLGWTGSPTAIIKRLNDTLDQSGLHLLLVVDGIDGASDPSVLKRSIAFLCRALKATRIKLCISCRDVDWEFFVLRNNMLAQNIYVPKDRSASEYDMDSEKRYFELRPFEEGDFTQLATRYKMAYRLRGEFSERTKEICKQPLMLRLLAEAYAGERIPSSIRRVRIFEKYWEKKIGGTGRETEAQQFFSSMLSEARRQKKLELTEQRIVEVTGQTADIARPDTIFRRMLSEHVVLYRYRSKITSQNLIGFTYSSFFEYALTRHIITDLNWYGERGRISRGKILIDLSELLDEMQDNIRFRGVILFLTLLMEGRKQDVHTAMVYKLVNSGSEWQRLACKVFEGLEEVDDRVYDALYQVARRKSWQVRKVLAESLWARRKDYDFTIQQLRHWYKLGNIYVLRTMIWSLAGLHKVRPDEVMDLLRQATRSSQVKILKDTVKVLASGLTGILTIAQIEMR